MNELEKMRAGLWLHAVCPPIGEALRRTEELVFTLNALPPSQREEREAILKRLFGRVGRNCCLHSPFHCDFGESISIGDDFVGNFGLTILDEAPVTIGNDVWIGGHTVVTQGVAIGDGTVIGAGSVVTRDIPAGVVAVGNPCRVVRPVTEADRIAEVF